MSSYWDSRFMKNLDKKTHEMKYICEVGARYGDESLKLSQIFQDAKILSFECNPLTIDKCKRKLKNKERITFYDCGLGKEEINLPFYSYVNKNDGASSFLKRIDFDKTQKCAGSVKIRKLSNVMIEMNVPYLDLLLMDVQGYELNVLKGCESILDRVNYIIMEEPTPIMRGGRLPSGMYSKYKGTPNPEEIKNYMKKHNFIELERIPENYIEDNVMYKNLNFRGQ